MAKRGGTAKTPKTAGGKSQRARSRPRDVDVAPRRSPRPGPVDVAPATPKAKRIKAAEYEWTPERDEQLRVNFTGHRGDIASLAKAFGLPFHVVKRRAKFLKLTGPSSTGETTRQRPRKRATSPTSPATTVASESATTPTPAELPAARLRHASGQVHLARCRHCKAGAKFRSLSSGQSFELIERYGVDAEATFGVGDNGRPMCPNDHGEMPLADEQLPASEAISETARQLALIDTAKPFNWRDAFAMVEEIDDELDAQQVVLEEALRDARACRKEIGRLQKKRTSVRQEIKRRAEEKRQQDRVRAEKAQEREDLASSRCSFEANTKKPCPICQAESPALVIAALDASRTALTDITSEAHRIVAITANSRTVDTTPTPALVARALQLHDVYGIDAAIVETWNDEQRREVLAWAKDGAPLEHVPSVIGAPHIAGEVGTEAQSCLECGCRLLARSDHPVFYPKGAYVGVNCPGADDKPVETVETPAAEARG